MSEKDNVVGFSGKRIAPTTVDFDDLLAFCNNLTWLVEEHECLGFGIVMVLKDEDGTEKNRVVFDWMRLPGCDKHALVAGTNYLLADLMEDRKGHIKELPDPA